jgi:hypothetical protein
MAALVDQHGSLGRLCGASAYAPSYLPNVGWLACPFRPFIVSNVSNFGNMMAESDYTVIHAVDVMDMWQKGVCIYLGRAV